MASAEIGAISRVVALVTGGASGLGRATVARLARQVSRLVDDVLLRCSVFRVLTFIISIWLK